MASSSSSSSSSAAALAADKPHLFYLPSKPNTERPDPLFNPPPSNATFDDCLHGDNSKTAELIRAHIQEQVTMASKRAREEEEEDDLEDEDGTREGKPKTRRVMASGDGYRASGAASGMNYLTSINPDDKARVYEPFFGMPNRPVQLDPRHSYAFENRDLPEAYEGESLYSKSIILNEIFESDLWYVTEALPWIVYNSTAPIVLDRFIFDTAVLSRTPYRAPSRLVTTRKDSRRAGLVRYGLQQELEYDFYKTEKGRMVWAGNQEQIKFSSLEMICFGVVLELLNCWQPNENLSRALGAPMTTVAFRNVLARENERWDSIHCYKHSLDVLAESMLKRMQANGVRPQESRLIFYIPQGSAKHATYAPENNEYRLTGVAKPTFDAISTRALVRGVGKTYESKQFRLGAGNDNDFYDPMFQEQMYGIKYELKGWTSDAESKEDMKNYRTGHCDVKVYQAAVDDFVKLSYKEAFDANQLYDQAGNITPVGRCVLAYSADINEDGLEVVVDYVSRLSDSPEEALRKKSLKERLWVLAVAGAVTPKNASQYLGRERGALVAQVLQAKCAADGDFHQRMNAVFAFTPVILGSPSLDEISTWLSHVSLDRKNFFEFCLREDIPIYMPFEISVPWIRWMAGSAILLEGGGAAGNTYVGNASYRRAFDAVHGNFKAHFNLGSRSLVRDPRRVVVESTAWIGDYVGGDDGTYFKTEEDKRNLQTTRNRPDERRRSMFAFAMIPECAENLHWSPYHDITGEFARGLVDSSNRPHCDTAYFYAMHWGLQANERMISRTPVVRTARGHYGWNTITSQGLQLNYQCSKRDWVAVVRNHGPWGDFLDAGFQRLKRMTAAALPKCDILCSENSGKYILA